jgi:hypothetical protein
MRMFTLKAAGCDESFFKLRDIRRVLLINLNNLHLALRCHEYIIHAQEGLLECHLIVLLFIVRGAFEGLLEISRNKLGHLHTAMAVVDTEETRLITSGDHRWGAL